MGKKSFQRTTYLKLNCQYIYKLHLRLKKKKKHTCLDMIGESQFVRIITQKVLRSSVFCFMDILNIHDWSSRLLCLFCGTVKCFDI